MTELELYKFISENNIEWHKQDNDETEAILIRGWGGLTGIGGLNLSTLEAAHVQDTFAEYIVKQLNRR